MKNIHILPTDKPSRFYKRNSDSSFDFSTSLYPEIGNSKNQNIYITNDEEIKDGDWFLTDDKRVEKCAPDWRAREWHKKIILTTDQDLIENNVQAIDDEFLEWFVKYPSCESVEVLRYPIERLYTIIPKEEPTIVRFPTYYESKQETTLEEVVNNFKKTDVYINEIKQEQDKNLYSLDNLKEAFAMGRTNATIKDFNTKFKNK